jgi:hypothetical protein
MVLTARRAAGALLRRQKWIAAALCGFEIFAIATGRAPTLTELSTRHRLLGPALVGALAVHLFRQPRVHVQQIVVADPRQIPQLAS